MELIQTTTVGAGGAASISFSSIPATFDDLLLVLSHRPTNTASIDETRISFNGSTSNFSARYLEGAGAGSGSSGSGLPRYIGAYQGTTASTFNNAQLYIPNYRSGVAKSYSVDAVTEANQTTAYQTLVAGLWNDTTAINAITITLASNNFAEGSSASLYGIRKFNTTTQPKATGGAISYDAVNQKWVHVFTASGTFTPTQNLTGVEYLVVAGGGGGGRASYGGGGGAGGYRSSVVGQASGGGASAEATLSLTSGVGQTVTVGAGGASFTNGSNSTFSTITATGGGRGGSEDGGNFAGAAGGSGGGESLGILTPGAGTTGQGFSGGLGNSPQVNHGSGGGGGGAGSAGASSSGFNAGNGGNGVTSNITGTSIARAGGGGGSGTELFVQGFGQAGGGNGSQHSPTSALANTGSGGGGRGSLAFGFAAGAGGSGIVIVRYS